MYAKGGRTWHIVEREGSKWNRPCCTAKCGVPVMGRHPLCVDTPSDKDPVCLNCKDPDFEAISVV